MKTIYEWSKSQKLDQIMHDEANIEKILTGELKPRNINKCLLGLQARLELLYKLV